MAALGWIDHALPGEPVVLFTQTANASSMRLAARLGFIEVERFHAWDAEQWLGLRPPIPRSGWLLSGVATFVLIPGAGGSAWVWSRVTRFLVEAGHEAIAVDLPGDDETAGLPRYAELVVDAIGSRSDVVLVAGSLGGFTAPIVCERVPVRELVLVNAMIPAPGERARDWWAHTGAVEAQDEAARAGGYGPFDLATYFLHDVDAEIAAEGEAYQRSEADIAFESVCDFTAWPAIRIRVLAGADDRFFPVGFQRRVARDRIGVEADVLPGGHLLPLVQARLVADYPLQTTRP